jgi:hypothetical protein
LRFWNNEVFQNLSGVLQTIAAELSEQAAPTLTLPRLRGRENPDSERR